MKKKKILVLALVIAGLTLSGCQVSEDTKQVSKVQTNTETKTVETTDNNSNAKTRGSNSKLASVNTNNSNDTNASKAPAAPGNAQRDEAINKYIAGVAKVMKGEEYEEARKVVVGDLDGDGDDDAAAQFTIEGTNGNYYSFHLAAFRNDNGKFTGVTDETVGGKLDQDVELTKIEDGKILIDTKGYAKDDGACCPSIAGKTAYILKDNKLTEVKNNSQKNQK